MNIEDIKEIFPGLKQDNLFNISSPADTKYNCIAWAYKLFKDRWMSTPKGMPYLDGVTWWPDGVTDGSHIDCLIEAFLSIGFVKCLTFEHEIGFFKVALYYNPSTENWTHAARESQTGKFWMSKLGQANDIHHGTPYTIENDYYGKVYCIMKQKVR